MVPGLKLGRFRLIKILPVASGLGGGSADAAAALRLIARANDGALSEPALTELAPKLGSDVSVCLFSRPALIAGRGEKVEPVAGFPPCGVLLANPGRALATEAVYAALRAAPLAAAPRPVAERLDFHGDFEALLAYATPRGNDLEGPAAPARAGDQGGARRAGDAGRRAPCPAVRQRPDLLCPIRERARGANAPARGCTAEFPAWWIAAAALSRLERAVDAELDGFEQSRLGVGIGEDRQRVAGDGAVMARPLHGVAQGVVLLHQAHGLGEIVRRRSSPSCSVRCQKARSASLPRR